MLSNFDAEVSTVDDFDAELGEDTNTIMSAIQGALTDGYLIGNREQKYVINSWRAYCELERRTCIASEYGMGDKSFVHVELASSPELEAMLAAVAQTRHAQVEAADVSRGRMTVRVEGDPEFLAAQLAEVSWLRRRGLSTSQSFTPSDDPQKRLPPEEENQRRRQMTPEEESQLPVAQERGYVVLSPRLGRASQWNPLFKLYFEEMVRRRQPSIVVGPKWGEKNALMVITRDRGDFLFLRGVAKDYGTTVIEAPVVGFFCVVVEGVDDLDRAELLAKAMVRAWTDDKQRRERSIATATAQVHVHFVDDREGGMLVPAILDIPVKPQTYDLDLQYLEEKLGFVTGFHGLVPPPALVGASDMDRVSVWRQTKKVDFLLSPQEEGAVPVGGFQWVASLSWEPNLSWGPGTTGFVFARNLQTLLKFLRSLDPHPNGLYLGMRQSLLDAVVRLVEEWERSGDDPPWGLSRD